MEERVGHGRRQKWSTQNDWKHNSKDECNILSQHFSWFAPFAEADRIVSDNWKEQFVTGEERRLSALILLYIHEDIMLNYGTKSTKN